MKKGQPRAAAKIVVYKGEPHELPQLCRDKGVKLSTAKSRLARGWSVEDAVDKPVVVGNPKAMVNPTGRNQYTHGLGPRSQVVATLFEIFAEYGRDRFITRLKEEIDDDAMKVFKTYIMPLVPKDSLQVLDGEKTEAAIITIDVNTSGDIGPMPPIINIEPKGND